jgi:hypothetical protein
MVDIIANIIITDATFLHYSATVKEWRNEGERAYKDKSYGVYQHYASRTLALQDKLDAYAADYHSVWLT